MLSEKFGAGICCLLRAFKKKKTFLPLEANTKPICSFWIVVNLSDREASYNQLDFNFFMSGRDEVPFRLGYCNKKAASCVGS